MRRIELVTLDLDNTLWDVDSVIIKAEADMLAWLEASAPAGHAIYQSSALDEARQAVFERHADRSHDLSFMRTAVLTDIMCRAGYSEKEAQKLAKQAFRVFFEGRNRVEFFPGALEMLEALAAEYPVFALTNGNADIERAGLAAFLRGAFSSADVGVKKPHPRMFETPLRHAGVDPERAVHVGDHLIDDVQGAADVGMHTIWVNLKDDKGSDATGSETDVKPTVEVRDLTEVADAIRRLAR